MSADKNNFNSEVEIVYKSLTEVLRERGDPLRIMGQQNYFKNEVKFVGLTTGEVRSYTRMVFDDRSDCNQDFIFTLVERLMSSMVFEYRGAAIHLATLLRKQWQDEDFYLFQSWVERYVDNWVLGDEIANHLLDKFILDDPQTTERTFKWAASSNPRMRRASAVCLVVRCENRITQGTCCV